MRSPKPKYCGQNWLNMKPTGTGRLCGKCHKNIVDFSRKKWSEIEEIQQANNHSVCGMYSNRQLKHWGREVEPWRPQKAIAATALLVGLTTGSAFGQGEPITPDSQRVIVRGVVTGVTEDGIIDTLSYARVILKHTNVGVLADEYGQYAIDITDYPDINSHPTLIFSQIGFADLEYELEMESSGNRLNLNPQLAEEEMAISVFYVTKPSLWRRITYPFRRLFRKRK